MDVLLIVLVVAAILWVDANKRKESRDGGTVVCSCGTTIHFAPWHTEVKCPVCHDITVVGIQ